MIKKSDESTMYLRLGEEGEDEPGARSDSDDAGIEEPGEES